MSEINENVMPEEEGVVILTDEDDNEIRFEIVAQTEKNGNTYFAMVPIDDQKEDSEVEEYVILKAVPSANGDEDEFEDLISIDDDEEFDRIADIFDDLLMEEYDYDAEGSDEE